MMVPLFLMLAEADSLEILESALLDEKHLPCDNSYSLKSKEALLGCIGKHCQRQS